MRESGELRQLEEKWWMNRNECHIAAKVRRKVIYHEMKEWSIKGKISLTERCHDCIRNEISYFLDLIHTSVLKGYLMEMRVSRSRTAAAEKENSVNYVLS